MGELPPDPTSQGVDHFELERLRVLVRFEFERELTQEELVVALTRCHNNTREAYHFLKEQRRQAQLQAASDMVAAAMATAHDSANVPAAAQDQGLNGHNLTTTSNGPSSGNGAKRRSDSNGEYDGDVKMDTPNKRPRSSAADIVTVDLSQVNDNVDMTQLTQENDSNDTVNLSHKRPRHYNLERASQILTDVVGTITLSARTTQNEAQWLSAALEALAVKRAPHVDTPLVVVVEALANALRHVPGTDIVAVRSDGVQQIMDVLVQLPRQDQYDVELRLEPSTTKMNEDVGKVENSFACANATHLKRGERAQAARNAITVIKDALSSCITRQHSILSSGKSAQSHRRRVRARIADLKKSIQARLDQAGKDVATSENDMIQARNNQMTHTSALMKVVMQHKEAYLAQGEEEADATLNAHAAVVHSTDAEVVRLRQIREESQLLFKARRQDVMRANTRLEFYQKLEALRQKILPCVQDWLDESTRQVEMLTAEAERFVEDKLKNYVSMMILALRHYYDFHTTRQQLATKEREKQKETLSEHMEFYDDLVPSSKKEIENKIREFNGVIVHSTQCMREVASLQSELWEGKRKLFQPHVFAVVEHEYGKLWNELSGGAKDMMLDCVKVIRDQESAAPFVPSPVSSPVNVGRTQTVAPYEFVRRDFDSIRPQPVRGAMLPPASPVVDLTGDLDEDVTMDQGFDRERFMVFPPSDRPSKQTATDVSSGSPIQPPNFVDVKMEEKASEPEVTSVREFPIGSQLCWMLKDEFGETDVYSGTVKGQTPSGSYILEDGEGLEHVIPVGSLFTHEEREAFAKQQASGNNEAPNKEGCVLM